MKTINAEIISNELISLNEYQLTLKIDQEVTIKAGNFFMLGINDNAMILKRPIAVYDYDNQNHLLEFIYIIVGNGTQKLASLKKGQTIPIIGPLGNNFPIVENKKVLIITGGSGLYPLYLFAKENQFKNKILFLSGFKSKKNFGIKNVIEKLKIETRWYSEDDSLENHGYPTQDLKNICHQFQPDLILTCGNTPLMKEVYDQTIDFSIPLYASFEARMACGFGACMGCSKPINQKMQTVCQKGPIFQLGKDHEW